jgi:hypothetical protein
MFGDRNADASVNVLNGAAICAAQRRLRKSSLGFTRIDGRKARRRADISQPRRPPDCAYRAGGRVVEAKIQDHQRPIEGRCLARVVCQEWPNIELDRLLEKGRLNGLQTTIEGKAVEETTVTPARHLT